MTKILLSCTLLICSVVVMRLSIARFFAAVLSFFTLIKLHHLLLNKVPAINGLKFSLGCIVLLALGINQGKAQIHVEESFRNKRMSDKVEFGGTGGDWQPRLTAVDEKNEGNGWLRLTSDQMSKSGYVIVDQAFSSTLGIIAEFEYKAWGNMRNGGYGGQDAHGDGLSVFLYNGRVTNDKFKIGPCGASLGYAASNGSPSSDNDALQGGYFAVGFDEYGNFSSSGILAGGGLSNTGVPQSIAIRGPAIRGELAIKEHPDQRTKYLQGTTANLGNAIDPNLRNQKIAYETSTDTRPTDQKFHRKARIILLPTETKNDFTVEVQLQITPNGKFYTVMKGVEIGKKAPDNLRIGFAASTGNSVANHEIRDVKVTTPVDFTITKTASKIIAKATADEVTYKLLVANVGKNAAKAIITDILPKGLTLTKLGAITFTSKNGHPSDFKIKNTDKNANNNDLIRMSVDLPPGASGVITYKALTNVKDSKVFSLTNTATITPSKGFSDQNLNDNTSTAEVFIKPMLTNSSIGPICSGDPTTITLTSSPSNNTTTYQWTARKGQGNIVNFSHSGEGSVITEIFEARTISGTVIYTVTPTINMKDKTIHGDPKEFTVSVTTMPRSERLNDVTATLNHPEPVLEIHNKDGSPRSKDIILTWYDADGKTRLNPQPEFDPNRSDTKLMYTLTLLKQPGVYTYYVAQQYPGTCKSKLTKYAITIEGHIVLAFERSTVNAGDKTVLTASLTSNFVAPDGGITITLGPNGTSSAIENVHYTGPLPGIYIPAGKDSASTTINTKPDDHTAEGPKTLTINGAATGGYIIASTPTLMIKYQEQPIPITLKFTTSTVNGDGISKAKLTAIIQAPVDEDIIIHLGRNAASSTAVLDKNYTGFLPSMTIKKGTTSATVIFFTAESDFLIGGRTALVLTADQPTSSKGHNYVVRGQPSIDIIDMASAAIKLHFVPKTVTGGQSSILTASFSSTNRIRTGPTPVIRSVSPTTILLNRNDVSTANDTHYTGLPTSITIPALTNSKSTTIFTYPTTGDINIFNGDKLLRVGAIPPADGHGYQAIVDADLQIKYPAISHHITLDFHPSTVEGGKASVLTASLSGTIKAPTGGITITLIKNGSAIANANYTDNFNTIFIPANHHSASITVSTIHTNTIHGDLELNVSGIPPDGYQIASNATLHIVDHPNNKTITLTFSPTTVFGGDPATLIASLPDGIKAPEGGITITIKRTHTQGNTVQQAVNGADYEDFNGKIIYIHGGSISSSISIITKSNPIYRHTPLVNEIRQLTVKGEPTNSDYNVASTPTLHIDQHKKPIPIKLTLSSPSLTDKASEITSGSIALLRAEVELPPGKPIDSEGVVINLEVNSLSSTAIAGTHYNLAAPDHISGGTITQTITFNGQDILTKKQISIFSTNKQNIIGGRTRLAFTATCSNEKYYIVNDPFIDIIDKPANFPGVYFDPKTVICGTSSTLIAAFFESSVLQTPSGITSVSPTIIMLTPDASSSALSGTHYSGLPASITIPVNRSSFSITIHTVDTREVNIQRQLTVKGSSQGDDGHMITSTAILDILYPTISRPQIDPSTVLNKTICSGEPVDIPLKTTPQGSLCQWTARLVEGTVDGLADNNEGYAIVDVLKNTAAIPGKVIYTVTPITTMPNGAKVEGDPTQIAVTVLPISAKMVDHYSVFKDASEIISSPVDAKPNIIYTWYDKDKNKIHNSTGIDAQYDPPISEPGTYTYYMTETQPEHCPGDFGKVTITLTRSITLSFDTPTVGGGSQAKLTAKLAPGIMAPIGGVEILLTPTTDQSTTAKSGANYIGLIDKITIPAGENGITVDAFTATNNHIIDGSTRLTLTGTGPMSYDINKPHPTITILDRTGDGPKAKIITLAFDKHLVKGGDEAILTIGLPKNVTSALPIVVKLGKVKNQSTAKRNRNYQSYPNSMTIPADKNHIEYRLKTLSEGNLGDIKSLWVNGKASGYKINTDGINIKNPTKMHIPNVFTPNDDGENDFWIISDIEFYPKCTVTIYNRWGKKVFFSVGYTQPWDGKQNNEPLPVATYYYVIELKNGSKPLSGHVAIVR